MATTIINGTHLTHFERLQVGLEGLEGGSLIRHLQKPSDRDDPPDELDPQRLLHALHELPRRRRPRQLSLGQLPRK